MATLWDLIVAGTDCPKFRFKAVATAGIHLLGSFEFVESKEALSTNGSPRLAGDSMQDLDSSPLTPYTDRSTEAPASLPGSPPTPIDPKTCSPREYLEHFIFPVLLPGLAELLSQARLHRCFERKKTKFFPCDFLAEWLYNKNPARCQEQPTEVLEIPFVKEWLRDHPRPPLPLSLLLTEEQAAIIIQAFYRGYLGVLPPLVVDNNVRFSTVAVNDEVRREPEVQELRQWQRELREESRDIRLRVADFWASREPSEGAQTPSELDAGVSINVISPSPLNTPLL